MEDKTEEEMDKNPRVDLCFDDGYGPRRGTECFSEKIISPNSILNGDDDLQERK